MDAGASDVDYEFGEQIAEVTQRRDKVIGSALEAAPEVLIGEPALLDAFDGLDAAEIFRTSAADLKTAKMQDPHVSTLFHRAHGEKCVRCWRILPEVMAPKFLCVRCDGAVQAWDAAHAEVAA